MLIFPQARLLAPNKRARNISRNDDASASAAQHRRTHRSIGAMMVLLASSQVLGVSRPIPPAGAASRSPYACELMDLKLGRMAEEALWHRNDGRTWSMGSWVFICSHRHQSLDSPHREAWRRGLRGYWAWRSSFSRLLRCICRRLGRKLSTSSSVSVCSHHLGDWATPTNRGRPRAPSWLDCSLPHLRSGRCSWTPRSRSGGTSGI